MDIAFYDNDGRIVATQMGVSATDVQFMRQTGERFVVTGADMDFMWVPPGANFAAERPTMPARVSAVQLKADGVDQVAIGGLPQSCTLAVDGDAVAVAGGTFYFSALDPGSYELVVSAWPYLDWSVTVEAQR